MAGKEEAGVDDAGVDDADAAFSGVCLRRLSAGFEGAAFLAEV